jgi:hypothetical protein
MSIMDPKKATVDDINYQGLARTGPLSCEGCAADGDDTLCNRLPTCIYFSYDIIWIKEEEEDEDRAE